MPDGYDPGAIAAQALTELLQERKPPPGRDPQTQLSTLNLLSACILFDPQ